MTVVAVATSRPSRPHLLKPALLLTRSAPAPTAPPAAATTETVAYGRTAAGPDDGVTATKVVAAPKASWWNMDFLLGGGGSSNKAVGEAENSDAGELSAQGSDGGRASPLLFVSGKLLADVQALVSSSTDRLRPFSAESGNNRLSADASTDTSGSAEHSRAASSGESSSLYESFPPPRSYEQRRSGIDSTAAFVNLLMPNTFPQHRKDRRDNGASAKRPAANRGSRTFLDTGTLPRAGSAQRRGTVAGTALGLVTRKAATTRSAEATWNNTSESTRKQVTLDIFNSSAGPISPLFKSAIRRRSLFQDLASPQETEEWPEIQK